MNRRLQVLLLCLLLLFACGALALPMFRVASAQNGSTQDTKMDISQSAMQQIQALQDEKESRTPAQRKINSKLIYAIKSRRGEALPAGVQAQAFNVNADQAGRVVVDIRATVDDALVNALKKSGAEIYDVSAEYHNIRAKVSLDQLESIAGLKQVHFIMPKQEATTNQATGATDSEGTVTAQPASTFPSREERLAQIQDALSQAIVEPNDPQTNVIPNGYNRIGAASSEGVITHRAYSARGTFNVDGTGIRIGVLSDGVTNLAASQATGDNPPTCSSPTPPPTERCVQVVPGQAGSGDEGTAMLEIIHDIAPGAQLYFATAFSGSASFAANIRQLRTIYNCDIIVDDVGYFAESPFQDGQAPTIISSTNGGIITQAVNDVVAAGAMYFSSAANSGNKNDGTSGTYEGDFVDSGSSNVPGVTGGTVHNFGGGQQFDTVTATNGSATTPYTLFWSDPLGSSSNDYDLYALNSAGTTIIDFSNDIQDGTPGSDPIEAVGIPAATVNARLVVFKKTNAANRYFHLDTNRGRLSISTAGNTHGHNAASGGYGVAATPAYSPFNFPPPFQFGPYPGIFNSANVVELFSSDGPRRIFYNGDGTPITPGCFLASCNGGTVLQQPLITAADGVEVTGAGGFPNPFFGTSAAAPHAAAIAGLLKSAPGGYTPAQIKTALTTTAIDIETAGTDRDAGTGIVIPYTALQALGATGMAYLEPSNITATEALGNGNGLIQPGENGQLSLTLNNTGLLNATGISATLTTSTPSVTILNNSSTYPNLAPSGGASANTTQFTFQLANSPTEIDRVINFTLTINYAGGWNSTQVVNFTVQTGRQPITTVLDAAAPATSVNFPVTSTGTQTARTFRADPPSSCGTMKAQPGVSGTGTRRYDSYTLTNVNGSTACATITLTPDKASTGFLQAVAYLGSFNPSNIATNFLGDIGASPFATVTKSFSVNVPAGATIVVVVNEVTALDNALNTPYTLQVSGLAIPGVAAAGSATLVSESCPPSNGAIDPGERVTVNLGLTNNTGASTSNLTATLQSSANVTAPSAPQNYGALTAGATATRPFSFTANGTPGQTITLTLQLQDGANNLGTVNYSVTLGNNTSCSQARLVTSNTLSRSGDNVVATVTVQNQGITTATNVTITSATLGATSGTPVPQSLGNLAAGQTATTTVTFANAGASGTRQVLRINGVFDGTTGFGKSQTVTLP